MVCKIIRAIIYVEMVLKQWYALYFLLLNMKNNSFLLYVFWRDCENRPIAWRHRDTRNKLCCKNSWFLLLTYSVLYAFRISVWNDVFLNFVRKGADNRPYRKWSFNYLDILDSPEMTTYILCLILKQLKKLKLFV